MFFLFKNIHIDIFDHAIPALERAHHKFWFKEYIQGYVFKWTALMLNAETVPVQKHKNKE